MGVKTENKMAYEPVNKLIIQMSAPPLISMFFQYSYNLVDSMFVAGINEQALAAVSLAFPITTLMNALSVWIGVGVNVLIAGYLGQKNQQKANSAAALGVVISVVVGVLINFLSLFIINPYYSAFTQNKEIFEYGIAYMSVCVFMQIPNMVHIVIQKILQATGNMIFPMLSQLFGAIVNIIFDPLLIFGIGIFPELGVLGAAIATVFGQFCGMVFCLCILFFKNHEVKVSFKNFKLNGSTLKSIYVVGFPSVIMQSIGSVMIIGLNQGVMPIIGYNYGARKKKRMYSALKRGIIIGVIIMAVGTILMWTIPEQLIAMFGGTQDIMDIGVPAFRIISLCFIPAAAGIIFTTLFQAVGKGLRSLIMSFCRQLVLILPIAWVLSMAFDYTAVWYAFPIAEFFSLLLAIAFFVNLTKGDFKRLDQKIE